jgi:hypothetical protein
VFEACQRREFRHVSGKRNVGTRTSTENRSDLQRAIHHVDRCFLDGTHPLSHGVQLLGSQPQIDGERPLETREPSDGFLYRDSDVRRELPPVRSRCIQL